MNFLTEQSSNIDAEDLPVLEDILDANGLSLDDLTNGPEPIRQLELFLFNFPKMVCLNYFPALRTLQIAQQDITVIENLDACVALERLWVIESRVQQINGLEKLQSLKCLYLYSNRIKEIENLNSLQQLEVLWLSDNYIQQIKGLEMLTNLQELNLARNDISHVGDVLANLTRLETLNLSDNPIGSFKEIGSLAKLPKLTDLCFADPFWGECPLASLCNYQTYVLFMLSSLTSLDTLVLAEETKQLAEATYMKKSMYYNMRIKTLRRHANHAISLAAAGKKAKLQKLAPLYMELQQQRKVLQNQVFRSQDGETAEMQQKLDEIQWVLEKRAVEVMQTQASFNISKRITSQLMDAHVKRMLLELETGGNIRMEDGKPNDLWFSSCADLLKSRFSEQEFKAFGITGVNVTRVIRVNNRFLRNRFDRTLSAMADTSDQNYKQSLEYLFLGDHPALPGHLLQAAEDGLLTADAYGDLGMDGAVCVSNSLCIADTPRILAGIESKGVDVSAGKVLVVKVYLGAFAQDPTSIGSRRHEKVLKENKVQISSLLEGPRITAQAYPGLNAVYRTRVADSKQKLWYVFDNTLVLPEYLVEYRYNFSPASPIQPHASTQDQEVFIPNQNTMEQVEFDVRHISRPLFPWISHLNTSDTAKDAAEESDVEQGIRRLLSTPPSVQPQQAVYMITDDVLKRCVNSTNLSSITYLSLHKSSLRRIENLEGLAALRVLVLSFNEISKMEGLSELRNLQRLELDHNLIRRIDGIKNMSQLEHLELQSNYLNRLDDINSLKKYNSSLVYLNLEGNPLTEEKMYKDLVIRRLSLLQCLDGLPITEEDRAKSTDSSGILTVAAIKEYSVLSRRELVHKPEQPLSSTDEEWLSHVEEIALDGRRLRRLQHLNKLANLRRATFVDNELTRTDGLELCMKLEELCLQDNRLTSIDGLTSLTALRKLEIGQNKISTISALSSLTNLNLLSVESNELESISGVEHMISLMEFYAGSNRISEFKEVQRLRELPKLIILDLLGNTVCSLVDYRLYVIFNVRRLKVLDGYTIDAGEQAAAKSKYAGRLTLDFLEDKIGHKFFGHIRELDISGLRIRDVGTVFMGDDFESLVELNLENNAINDISGLVILKQLTVLRLAGNRIGVDGTFSIKRMQEKAATNGCSVIPEHDQLADGDIFPQLQILQLGNNQITSIASLSINVMTSLRSLFLYGNDISRVDGLDGLVNLQELVLDRNRIRNFDSDCLTSLRRLHELRVDENGVKSVGYLTCLTSLRSLHLGCNRIPDIAEIEKLSTLTNLLEISLVNNPVARKQTYRAALIVRVPSLRLVDGVPVSHEEREYALAVLAPPTQQMTVSEALAGSADQPKGVKIPMKLVSVNFDGMNPSQPQVFVSVPSIQLGGIAGPQVGLGLEGVGIKDNNSGRDVGSGDAEWGRPLSTDKRAATGSRTNQNAKSQNPGPGGRRVGSVLRAGRGYT